MNEEQLVTAESITEEFPGWEAWQGIDHLWGEDLEDLRNQIVRKVSQVEQEAYRRQGA